MYIVSQSYSPKIVEESETPTEQSGQNPSDMPIIQIGNVHQGVRVSELEPEPELA